MSLRTAVAHRNLLYLLSLKELRTRYRKSVLGWAWSLLNPISQMIIFSFVFLVVFKAAPPIGVPSGLEVFPLYFLSGMLPFQFFSISVTTAIGVVDGNASLIKKVAFPHEHLVFSVVIAQVITLCIELVVLAIALMIAGANALPWLIVSIPLIVLLMIFTTGVALALSAANVFFHDINYLWGIVSQLLFYASPIIYTPIVIENDALRALTNWGPTGSFVRAFHEVLYDNRMPGLGRWVHLIVISFVVFAIGSWIFGKLSPRFAEEM
ncbi:MAG: ABC transporter permease [Ilumatobacteraceae bacterium]